MKKRYFVGVDLGATGLMAVVVDAKDAEDARHKTLGEDKRKTHPERGADEVVQRIAKTVEKAVEAAGLKLKHVSGIGIGAPGPINVKKGVVRRAVNLGADWENYPLGKRLGKHFDLPVVVDNDVNVGALGEYTLGAGRGAQNLVAIFVGSGIGGGIVVDGKLYRGSRGAAGEVGHMIVQVDGPLCGCGNHGCIEALAGRIGMEARIREAAEAGRETLLPQVMQELERDTMSSSVLATAIERGDELAQEILSSAQRYLGLHAASVINFFDPDVVVFGGGFVERFGEPFLEPIREVAYTHLTDKEKVEAVRIVPSALGDHAGALGAAVLARQSFG